MACDNPSLVVRFASDSAFPTGSWRRNAGCAISAQSPPAVEPLGPGIMGNCLALFIPAQPTDLSRLASHSLADIRRPYRSGCEGPRFRQSLGALEFGNGIV